MRWQAEGVSQEARAERREPRAVADAATRQVMGGRPRDEARTELLSFELWRRELLGDELLGCKLLSREPLSCELAGRPVTKRRAGRSTERHWAREPRATVALIRCVAKPSR